MLDQIQPSVASQSFLILDQFKFKTKGTSKSAEGLPSAANGGFLQSQSNRFEELRVLSIDGTNRSETVSYSGNAPREREPAVVTLCSRVALSSTTNVEPSPMLAISMPVIPQYYQPLLKVRIQGNSTKVGSKVIFTSKIKNSSNYQRISLNFWIQIFQTILQFLTILNLIHIQFNT